MKTRIKNLMVIILIGSFMIYSILSGIERLIWANVKNYPAFLINDTIQLDSIEKVYELIDITCNNKESEIIERKGDRYIRCGVLWPFSKVIRIVPGK